MAVNDEIVAKLSVAMSRLDMRGPLPGDVIASERRATGLTTSEMADRLKFVEPDYTKIENGLRLPSQRFVRAFAEICSSPRSQSKPIVEGEEKL